MKQLLNCFFLLLNWLDYGRTSTLLTIVAAKDQKNNKGSGFRVQGSGFKKMLKPKALSEKELRKHKQ
jgi:hypothetical protein